MIVNICGYKYRAIYGHWAAAYYNMMQAFLDLGFEVHTSPYLSFQEKPEGLIEGINTSDAIHVYNHSYIEEIKREGYYRNNSKLNIFIKPTGPTPLYFTLDTKGYGPYIKDTNETFGIQSELVLDLFFSNKVQPIISSNMNKWIEPQFQFLPGEVDVPDNHILVIGQMTADTTVTEFSFGSHWDKISSIVNFLLNNNIRDPIVLKLHPTLKSTCIDHGAWAPYERDIKQWESKGVKVLDDFSSIHKVLPKTKVAIVENSTSGIEVLMHRVPLISYGYPEYVKATKDLRHLADLKNYVEDLSWYDRTVAGSWLLWYLESYSCFNYDSTKSRIKTILTDAGIG